MIRLKNAQIALTLVVSKQHQNLLILLVSNLQSIEALRSSEVFDNCILNLYTIVQTEI